MDRRRSREQTISSTPTAGATERRVPIRYSGGRGFRRIADDGYTPHAGHGLPEQLQPLSADRILETREAGGIATPARITSREQAGVLMALDSSLSKADRQWRACLVSTLRDFVIWGSPQAGKIDKDKAQWLVQGLRSSSPKIARAVQREVIEERLRSIGMPRMHSRHRDERQDETERP